MAMSKGSIVSFVVGIIFIVAGGGIGFYIGKPILEKAKASASWPTTEGSVIVSELERRRKKKSTTYEAAVVFKYEVAGEELEGDKIWFGQYSSSNRSEMQALLRQYPVGKKVTVYYSPDEPSAAVLQPGAFKSSYMVYGIGMLFLGIGCLLLLIPLIKLVLVTTIFATSSANSFAGGPSANDEFSSRNLSRHDGDDDGFDGIPGS